MGKIVSLGEIVSDIYREEEASSEMGMPFTARPGGAPANVAVAAARLGAKASFLGSVGEDLFGDFVIRLLRAEGVDVSGVRRATPPARTSIAFVELADGDRSFTFYRSDPAADELLCRDDVERKFLSGASFVNFGSIPLLKEPSRSAIHRAVELADELDVPVAFDVNLRLHLWESTESAREAINPLIDVSRIVKLSDDELDPLLGIRNIEEAADALLRRGVSLVLVSRGEHGAFYATPTFRGNVPAFQVNAVDSTGAGDAFLAATLVHLSGRPLEEACVCEAAIHGTAAGALACTGYGALQTLPTHKELEKLLINNASKIP